MSSKLLDGSQTIALSLLSGSEKQHSHQGVPGFVRRAARRYFKYQRLGNNSPQTEDVIVPTSVLLNVQSVIRRASCR